MSYDPLDREQHRVLANGGTISHTWDAAGREILIENRNAAGVGQFIATNTYSPVDTRLTVIELNNALTTYGYDASRQIISEARSGTYPYNTSYVFDPNGNRLQQYDSGALTRFTLNAANELLVIAPGTGAPTTQSFDAVGNMIGANTGGALTTQTWSGDNRMLSLQNSTGTNESYLYSQDGLRKEKTNSSGTTVFTWDEQNVLLETSPSGVVLARNTDFPGYWGGLTSQNRGGVSNFFGYDSQGSVRILTSILGAITDYYAYMAFGVELPTGATTVNPNRYLGRFGYYRDFMNWMYVRARLLDALRGRWVKSRDELGFDDSGDLNPYRYVGNVPTVRLDPNGLVCSDAVIMPFWWIAARLATMGCIGCALAIKTEWMGNARLGNLGMPKKDRKPGRIPWQHDCNGLYAHCMACCTLTRLAGIDCAATMQNYQDSRYPAGPQKSQMRQTSCFYGAGVAIINKTSCHQGCSSHFNNWLGYPNAPECKDAQKIRNSIPFMPDKGFSPLSECSTSGEAHPGIL